jgi:predicted AAA+ superfamily ATPase
MLHIHANQAHVRRKGELMPLGQLQAKPRWVIVLLHKMNDRTVWLRGLNSFNRFLEAAALINGEIVNYQNVATDCGISANTVREYFSILTDTILGYMIPAFQRTIKRKLVQAPRFYYFDVGIVNYLLNRKNLLPGSADFGHAFEHLILQEIIAYLGYSDNEHPISYWRTSGGAEVDVILGDARVAIEIKSVTEIQARHLKGLKTFAEENIRRPVCLPCR